MTRAPSTLFTAIPSALWLMLVLLVGGNDYFWPVYRITCGIFLAISLALGFFGPTLFPRLWQRRPGVWIFGQGLLAWLAACLVLGMLNLTPLCVGQDNGDGNNDIFLCIFQSALVGIFYTPLELVFLVPGALTGGLLLRNHTK